MFRKCLVYGFFFALGIMFERQIGFDRAMAYCREWWGSMGCCSGGDEE